MLRARTLVLFLLASVLFGGTYVAAKAGGAYFPPVLLVALRYDVAAVVLLGYVFATRDSDDLYPGTRRDVAGIAVAAVFALALTNGLLFVGQQYTTSAVGSVIFSLGPVLTPVFAAVLLADERLSAHGAVGTVVGLFGVALVVGFDPAALLGADAGVGILFAGAVSSALGAVLVRRADASLSSTVQTAWALPVSALLLHAASPLAGESVAAVTWTPAALVALGYLGVLAGAVAYVAYFGLLAEVGATRSSLIFYVSPAVATLGGWLVLGETVSPRTVAGFAVVAAGFAVIGAPAIASALPSPSGGRDETRRTGPDRNPFRCEGD